MRFLGRFFAKRGKDTPMPPPTKAESFVSSEPETSRKSDLLNYLFRSKGTDELYEMLRSRSAAEIEGVCKSFPIESIRLDWGYIGAAARAGDVQSIVSEVVSEDGLQDIQRFELITVLAQILVNYEQILNDSPQLRLPQSLPASDLAKILMSRLMPFIASQQGVQVTETLRIRLYDFAMALMQAGPQYYSDALNCLLLSRPSPKEDHDFWIAACRYNIAQRSEARDDVSAAIEAVEAITSGNVKVPAKYVQAANQMLEKLRQITV